jgi:hypothetical protein
MIKTSLTDSPYNDSESSFLDVEIKGLGTAEETDDGRVVLVELYEGTWWVRVWADINQVEPTHCIDLSGAEHEKRIELF